MKKMTKTEINVLKAFAEGTRDIPSTNGVILHVIDKDGYPVGRIMARVGLKTYSGVITRLTPKGIEVTPDGGHPRVIRADCHLPSIYKSYAPKREILPIPGKEIAV